MKAPRSSVLPRRTSSPSSAACSMIRAMRLWFVRSMSEPIWLCGSAPGPVRTAEKAAVIRAVKSRSTERCTRKRVAATQIWPAMTSAPPVSSRTAASRSASSKTTAGALPPSSSDSRFSVCAAPAMIRLPVALDPVKLITSTASEATSASPTSVPYSLTEFTTPFGNDGQSCRHRITRWWTSGVCGAGLITTVQPAASAGPSERTRRVTGAFHGTMIAATPAASRFIVEKLPGAVSIVRPRMVRASPP